MIAFQTLFRLLEVNSSPSMEYDAPLDATIKRQMIAGMYVMVMVFQPTGHLVHSVYLWSADTIALVAPRPLNRTALHSLLATKAATGQWWERGHRAPRTPAQVREFTNRALHAVLGNREPGAVTAPDAAPEPPAAVGGYRRLAPSPLATKIVTLVS